MRFFKAVILLLLKLKNNVAFLLMSISWLRRRWNGSPVAIVGAEDEEYQLTIEDIDSSLVFMYTPVTEEGVKGEAQYKHTDFVKAGMGR